MRLKRCEHCTRTYEPQLSGLMAMLCRPCTMDCEEAYLKIRRYIKENSLTTIRVTDKEKIAEETKLPGVFVYALFKDGRFGNEGNLNLRACKSCQCDLADDEREFCATCVAAISKDVFHNLRDKTRDERPQPTTTQAQASNTRRYGLGRH